MSDPLVLLHEYAIGQRQVREITSTSEKYIVFDDLAFSKDTPTRLTVYGKSNEYYSIESILFLWNNNQLTHPVYVKEAAGLKIRAVTRPDRREIIDYLRGERREFPSNHDAHVPPRAPIPLSRLQADGEPDRKKTKLDASLQKGDRINQLLNKEGDVDASQLRSLNENLTADKIAALKMKRLNHQKKNVVTTVEDDMDIGTDIIPGVDRELKNRERVWRTRLNCMEAATKQFTPILDLLKNLKTREDTAARQKAMASQPPSSRGSAPSKPRQSQGYSRYDQEQFTQKDLPAHMDFQIDHTASFVGSSIQMGGGARNNTVLHNKPLASGSSAPVPRAPTTPSSSTDSSTPKKRTSKTPIIIIPNSQNCLINMYNVRDLLQDMRFVTAEEKRREGKTKENEVLLQRKRGDTTVPFRIVDNPLKLTDDEWDRVVAVFVMGPAWQFKGWRFKGNPVEIFAHVAAFHINYDDMKLDPNVAKWSVTHIALSKTKRHLDKARLTKFWDTLDRHIVKNKGYLRH